MVWIFFLLITLGINRYKWWIIEFKKDWWVGEMSQWVADAFLEEEEEEEEEKEKRK